MKYLTKLRETLAKNGLTLWSVGNKTVAKNKDIILGTKNRDKAIQMYVDWIKLLGKSGIKITIFTWEADGVWSTHDNIVRGNSIARACDVGILQHEPLKHGRNYTDEELWENMRIFLECVVPEAEKHGVTLAIHPNDPPTDKRIAGVPCIMRTRAAFDRVFELGNHSKNLRMELCLGTFLEGGTKMGNLLQCIDHFMQRDKVVIVHLRNVTNIVPSFTETFIDEGYGDVYELVRRVVKNRY